MKLSLYRMATTLGGPLIRLYLGKRLRRGKEDPERFHERLGRASRPRPDGKLVWMHAASVGESLSILALVDKVLANLSGWSVLVTTGTMTSARLMEERLPQDAIHQYVPVDRVSYVRRFLDHWRPDLALWVESEFWPNLVIETHERKVPMVVLNGRMSEASFQGWLKNLKLIQRMLSAFQLVLAQSERDSERFRTLGAANIGVPGNLKFAAGPLPVNDRALETMLDVAGERPRWLAASTHPGEEGICGHVHRILKNQTPDVLTIVVPRHPERGSAIAAELRLHGLKTALRSANQHITPDTDVYIADTLGELGLFYRLCDIVFMGKTLRGTGGQNPIEPAQLSCALIFGPDMSNFEDSAFKLLETGGARKIADKDELAQAVRTLIDDDRARIHAANAALDTASSEADVLNRVMEALTPYFTFAESGDTDART